MARKLKYNDEEGGMAKSQLHKIETYAKKLNEMIHPEDELEAWVQSKLSVVSAYMGDIKHYLDYELKKYGYGGGIKNNLEMYEVEFTWDKKGEDDYDSRKVVIYAESIEEDRNVWSLRGGWYTNPNTGVAAGRAGSGSRSGAAGACVRSRT